MKLVNSTPFNLAPLVGRLNFPGHSMTLIVKGLFNLSPGSDAAAVEEQPFPSGDLYYPDDDEMDRGPRYESDFAWFKPRADLLLVGRGHTPGEKPARTCPVTFQVGRTSKSLTIVGNRHWGKRGLRWKASDPEPFTDMELRYENSFGGETIGGNPVGKGDRPVKDEHGSEVWLLPNIEDPAQLIESPKSRPKPAGFGPLSRMWETRRSKTGTYHGKYVETRWPWFPEDFDWTHFNAAPEDMQIDGYLRGDEELYVENLHPLHAQYNSRLAGLRVRCFLNKLAASNQGETEFTEVPMNLDTLWVDMEAEKLVLVWRGWAEVLSEDYEEVQDVFVISEPLKQSPASLEECRLQFLERQTEEEKAWTMEEAEPQVATPEPEEAPEIQPPSDMGPDLDPACLQAQVNALLGQMGINPETLPPEVREKQSRLIRKLTAASDRGKVVELERQELDAEMGKTLARLGLDPGHLPPLSVKAKAEQLRLMKELGVKPAVVAATPELGRFWAIVGALLPKTGMDPENLDPLIEQVQKQRDRLSKQSDINEEEEAEKVEEAPPLTREIVQERAARGESFAGENLRALDLSRMGLREIDFSEANLTEAVLDDADLEGAIFASADLTKASLKKARLKEADLTGCILVGATLAGAVLSDAVLEKTQMAGAVLDQVEAKDADFAEADLTGTRLKKSACAGADFSKAVLDEADFSGADLREASMYGVIGRRINLAEAELTGLRASEGCDFSGGVFRKAVGPDSAWESANLTGTDFRGSRMQGATFTAACLKEADLSHADMKFSRFNKADLTAARLVRMNLFQGSLERANLTRADLSGSNMYGVEFLNAVMDSTETNGTNLKMTKLREK